MGLLWAFFIFTPYTPYKKSDLCLSGSLTFTASIQVRPLNYCGGGVWGGEEVKKKRNNNFFSLRSETSTTGFQSNKKIRTHSVKILHAESV